MDPIRIERRCNQRCSFCGADDNDENAFTTDIEAVFLRLKQAPPEETIEISGGEPTLSPLLPTVLALARKLGRRVRLQTNAILLARPEVCARLVQAGLPEAFVSLHAPTAEASDRLTGVPGSFELTCRGVENLLRQGVEVNLNAVIVRSNASFLVELTRFVHRRFGAKPHMIFSFVNPFHRAWEHRGDIPTLSEVRPFLHAALGEGSRLGLELHVPGFCGVPLCQLQGVESFSAEYEDFRQGRLVETLHPDRVKPASCSDCVWNRGCSGFWRRYIELYGAAELVPVTSSPE